MHSMVQQNILRPFGESNQHIVTEQLWNKLDAWMTKAYGGNDLTAINAWPKDLSAWCNLKCEVEQWSIQFSLPNHFEQLTAPDRYHQNPKFIQEQTMYRHVKDKLISIVEGFHQHCEHLISNNQLDQFYETYAAKAGRYYAASKQLHNICDPINRSWVRVVRQFQPTEFPEFLIFSIFDLSQVAWREKLLARVGDPLRNQLIQVITIDRQDENRPVNAIAMKNILRSLANSKYHSWQDILGREEILTEYNTCADYKAQQNVLNYYNFYKYFGTQYKTLTQTYLEEQGRRLLAEPDLGDIEFMTRLNRIIQREFLLANNLIPDLAEVQVDLLFQYLVIPNAERVVRQLINFIQLDMQNEIIPTFNLLSRAEGLQNQITSAIFTRTQAKIASISKRIDEETNEEVYQLPSAVKFGDTIIRSYLDVKEFIKIGMQGKADFYRCMNEGIHRALEDNEILKQETQDPNKVAGLLSQFVDYTLTKRTNNAQLDVALVQTTLTNISCIMTLAGRRDKIIEFLQIYLGRRLLRKRSVGKQLELFAIDLFNRDIFMPRENLDTMFADLEQSRSMKKFQDSRFEMARANGELLAPLNFELSIVCLTCPAWPAALVYDKAAANMWILPEETKNLLIQYKNYFELNNQSKLATPVLLQLQARLDWSPTVDGDTYSLLNCNAPMYLVLSYFGTVDEATYAQVKRDIGLDDANLIAVINVLCNSVLRLRRGAPVNPEIESILLKTHGELNLETKIRVNVNFNVPFRTINFYNANKIS